MRENVRSGALTEVTFFILLALYRPRHGYAVMQFVEEQTGGRLILGAGSLYGALGTLAKKGWIEPVGEDEERRKRYRITAEGRRIAAEEQNRLRELVKTAAEIIEAGETVKTAEDREREAQEKGRAERRREEVCRGTLPFASGAENRQAQKNFGEKEKAYE